MPTNPLIISTTNYIVIIIMLCDQFSKRWAANNLIEPPRIVRVWSFLDLNATASHGLNFIFFGYDFLPLFSSVLVAVGLVVFFILGRWRLRTASALATVGIGLTMGGIISNTVDLVRFGITAHFLDFHIGDYVGITLNVADVAIIAGLFSLIMDGYTTERPVTKKPPVEKNEE